MDLDLETVDAEVVDLGSANAKVLAESLSEPKAKRGRKGADIWALFTEENTPQQLKSAVCKHCLQRVNHHKKSECAKKHLLKCINFKTVMYGTPCEDRPDWFPTRKLSVGNSTTTGQSKLSFMLCSKLSILIVFLLILM